MNAGIHRAQRHQTEYRWRSSKLESVEESHFAHIKGSLAGAVARSEARFSPVFFFRQQTSISTCLDAITSPSRIRFCGATSGLFAIPMRRKNSCGQPKPDVRFGSNDSGTPISAHSGKQKSALPLCQPAVFVPTECCEPLRSPQSVLEKRLSISAHRDVLCISMPRRSPRISPASLSALKC